MKRRDFIISLFLVTITVSTARTEQSHRVAIVDPVVPVEQLNESNPHPAYPAFWSRLRQLGYEEGRNLIIERFSAGGRPERFSAMVREVVSHNPDLILTASTRIAKALTSLTQTIPIIGVTPDPVKFGLASSLARPGGNYTGISIDAGLELYTYRLALFMEAVPKISKLGFLISRSAFEKTPMVRHCNRRPTKRAFL